MDNPEGQVTYPILNRTAGLPTSSNALIGTHCVFILAFIIKPYGTINFQICKYYTISKNACLQMHFYAAVNSASRTQYGAAAAAKACVASFLVCIIPQKQRESNRFRLLSLLCTVGLQIDVLHSEIFCYEINYEI